MRGSRNVLAVAAVVFLAVSVRPAAAQPACPTPIPGTPRAGFTCVPLAGGGTTNATTCTFYGDVAWLLANSPIQIPAGTCGFELTFATSSWTSCPTNELLNGEIVAYYTFSSNPSGDPGWLTCNVPTASTRGLVALIILLAAAGALLLWRRTG